MITHIQGAAENMKLHPSITRYWGSFRYHSMWHNKGCLPMAWVWRHILAMDWLHLGWQKNHSHTYRRNTGRVCGQAQSTEGHFITPKLWTLVAVELIEALRNGWNTLRHALSKSAENNHVSQFVQEALSKERQWCGKTQLPIHPQKVQNLINILWIQVT